MKRQEVASLSELRERAWRKAWEMSASAAETAPPVPLHEFSARLRIQRIEFVPLLSTAGIGPVEGGYVIYISTRAPGAANIPKKCLELTNDDFAHLPSPLRFNVAHEMAHVFFFDVLEGDCRHNLLKRHWNALENSCNQMARVLLLPKKALMQEIGSDLFAVHNLIRVLNRFRVSPQVFIYRLHMADMENMFQGHDGGLIAHVKMGCDGPAVIAAHALGTFAKVRWPHKMCGSGGAPLEKLHLSVDVGAMMQRKEHVISDAEVFWRNEQIHPCKLEYWPFRRGAPRGIISVRLTDYLQPPKVMVQEKCRG